MRPKDRMNIWPTAFKAELFAGLLLDQNCEHDVFEVWVGSERELRSLAHVLEDQYKCTVIRENPSRITVCCPAADNPAT